MINEFLKLHLEPEEDNEKPMGTEVQQWTMARARTAPPFTPATGTFSGYLVWLENEYREKVMKYFKGRRRLGASCREPILHLVTGNSVPIMVVEDPVMLGVFP